jgi:hypothetical protein
LTTHPAASCADEQLELDEEESEELAGQPQPREAAPGHAKVGTCVKFAGHADVLGTRTTDLMGVVCHVATTPFKSVCANTSVRYELMAAATDAAAHRIFNASLMYTCRPFALDGAALGAGVEGITLAFSKSELKLCTAAVVGVPPVELTSRLPSSFLIFVAERQLGSAKNGVEVADVLMFSVDAPPGDEVGVALRVSIGGLPGAF